ncbi:M28 family peptidase [Olivibacter sitiensis]|uniref:M28 family peptidase n=1 Tax=Olivibacter sitiensis TaxID=376470 RepID=UPI00040A9175|nr:M28 family peptidase [Olivibacter sitiensis]
MFKFIGVLLVVFCSCHTTKPVAQEQTGVKLLHDLAVLSSDRFEGRRTGTPGNALARDYIVHRFDSLGLQTFGGNYVSDFSFKNRQDSVIQGKNVVGFVQGKGKGYIVVSAHYDHLGIRNGEIFNGADDNASGSAALLQFAEYFSKHQPEHSIIFAAFDAEEMGLQGAKAFVASPPVALGDIKLNINMDMIAHNDKGELYAAGTFYYPELKPYLKSDDERVNILLGHDDPKLGHDDWTNQSDQGAFHAKEIPFLYFGVEDHKDYHKVTDTFENINRAFYVAAVGQIQKTIARLDVGLYKQQVFRKSVISK